MLGSSGPGTFTSGWSSSSGLLRLLGDWLWMNRRAMGREVWFSWKTAELKDAWPCPLAQTFTTSLRLLRRNASSVWLKLVSWCLLLSMVTWWKSELAEIQNGGHKF